MNKLSNDKMQKIKGGAFNWGLMAGVGAIASFLIGIIDGWTTPKKCNY